MPDIKREERKKIWSQRGIVKERDKEGEGDIDKATKMK
jgi:hypothetical protein